MMRSSVVLPQPEGPRNTISSPRATASEIDFSASKRPKVLRMPPSSRKGSPDATAGEISGRIKQRAPRGGGARQVLRCYFFGSDFAS